VAIPFDKTGYGYYEMYLNLTYDGAAGKPHVQLSLGDSGFSALQMCCWGDLDHSKYRVLNDSYKAPFNKTVDAKLVIGSVALTDSTGAPYTLRNVTFYACVTDCDYHGIGLGVGEDYAKGVYSPLSPLGSAVPPTPRPVVRFDYAHRRLLLYQGQTAAPACKTSWMGVSKPDEQDFWTCVKVKQVLVGGRPVENWVTSDTEAFLDTGGLLQYLKWGDDATEDPFGKPSVNTPCPRPAFFDDAPDDWKGDSDFKGCVCRYSPEVVFSLADEEGRGVNVTFSQAGMYGLPKEKGADFTLGETPTLVTCKKANVGDGNWANLGGSFFMLNDVTFDYQAKEVCIEPRSAPL